MQQAACRARWSAKLRSQGSLPGRRDRAPPVRPRTPIVQGQPLVDHAQERRKALLVAISIFRVVVGGTPNWRSPSAAALKVRQLLSSNLTPISEPPPFSRIKRWLDFLHLALGRQPGPIHPFTITEPADQPRHPRPSGEQADDTRRRIRQVIMAARRMVDMHCQPMRFGRVILGRLFGAAVDIAEHA